MTPRIRRRWKWTLLATVVLLSLAIALRASLPTALSAGLKGWLEAQGASEVDIEGITLRLIDGRMELNGLRFIAGGKETHVKRARFELAWAGSGTQRLWFRQFSIEGLRSSAVRGPQDGWTFAGLKLKQGSSDEGSAFALMLDQADLSDVNVRLTLDDKDHLLSIDTLTLGLAIDAGTAAAGFQLRGRWNGIAADVKGIWGRQGTRQSLQGELVANKLKLDELTRELAAFSDAMQTIAITGQADVKAAFAWHREDQKADRSLIATLIQATDVRLDLPAASLSVPELAWQGQIRFSGSAPAIRGELLASPLHLRTPGKTTLNAAGNSAADFEWASDSLQWRGEIQQSADASWALTGDWTVESAAIRTGTALTLAADAVRLRGPLRFGNGLVQHEGSLNLDRVLVVSGDPAYRTQFGTLGWKGSAQINDKGPALQGALQAETVSLNKSDAPGSTQPLLTMASGQLDRVRIENQTLTSGDVRLTGINLFGYAQQPETDAETALQLKQGTLKGLRLSAAAFTADRVQLDGAALRIVRNAKKTWLPASLSAGNPAKPPQATTASGKDPDFALRINRILLGDPATLDFEDRAVSPPHRRKVELQTLQIDGVNTGSDQPARIKLAARVDRHAEFSAEGGVQLSASETDGSTNLDLRITARGLELPPFAGYLGEALQQSITSGQLDSDTTVHVKGGQLQADNAMTLRRLELKAGATGADGKTDGLGLGMPIDTALGLLRDSKGDIRLDLPVRGTLADPKFEIRDAIGTATRKAMQFAALSYVKQMIQPFGTLVTLVELGAKGLTAVRLDPLQFSPASTAFDSKGLQYLERVAALLRERPKLRLRVCGKAAKSELPDTAATKALSDEQRADWLLKLAQARAEAIKTALVSAHGIAADRLFLCQPETGEGESFSGRAELLI